MRLALLAAALLAVAGDAPKDDAAHKELDQFQGDWTAVSLQYNGKTYPDVAGRLRLTFKDNTATVSGDEEVQKAYGRVSLHLDPKPSPKAVDVTVTAGAQEDAAFPGIYELKGDDLTLCVRVLGMERPREFAAPDGSGAAVLVLKRQKK
jgi:uncharacterized protein (TIGR03067 family)